MALSLEEVYENIRRTLNANTDRLVSIIEKNATLIQGLTEKLQCLEKIKETVQIVERDTTEQAKHLKALEEKYNALEARLPQHDVPEEEGEHLTSLTDICDRLSQDLTAREAGEKNIIDDKVIKLHQDPSLDTDVWRKYEVNQCPPYPFGKYVTVEWYIEGHILMVPESGASDLIEPCHEFKGFTKAPEDKRMDKFVKEVIRYGAACINSRTNGTIHFGVANKPHGKILGVPVGSNEKEQYDQKLRHAINQRFGSKHQDVAQKCIKPPRFVEVRDRDSTPSGKFVIEVDIVPHHVICKNELFHTSNPVPKEKQFFVRDGSSSTNLLAQTTFDKKMKRYHDFVTDVKDVAELRKQSEEKHLSVVKSHRQGFKLSHMITGGTGSLDRSYYQQYIIVTNKSHPVQCESMSFLLDLRPAIIFDFDQQSAETGLYQYLNIFSGSECKDLVALRDHFLQFAQWRFPDRILCIHNSQASVQIVLSLSGQKPQKDRFLVVFLVLSQVTDRRDPLIETFCTLHQRLKSKEQILFICANKRVFTSLKSLINTLCGVDISDRCIYELSLVEVNGTIRSLRSENRRSMRFLPGAGGSRVLLEEELEHELTTLDVLCVNQCEGGNEDQVTIEQNFYRGGEVSWWNFYFSELPGAAPFAKMFNFDYITQSYIPELCSLREACVRFDFSHVPRDGCTTVAKHILWTLRKKLRCAVLTDNDADPETVTEHVVKLLKCGCTEQEPSVPVLLMIDNFGEMKEVLSLQGLIENQCNKILQPRSPHVIILNCMRSEKKPGQFEPNENK